MAAWQFYCNIISSAKYIDKMSCDEMILWNDIPCPKCEIDFLECKKSWAENIVQYGNIDETCIEFIYDENTLTEILCRLDLRTLTKRMLTQIVEYVQSIESCFLVDGNIYPPKTENMISVMKQSKAYQYCKNPLEYIKTLKG
ncbi:MAG: hypothetical protein HDR19_02575 [Lachnospiraceae bacterium]|nr:hypothetical protein [Lachnospiraceae bacterium]